MRQRPSAFEQALHDLHGEDVEIIDLEPSTRRPAPAVIWTSPRNILWAKQPPDYAKLLRLWLLCLLGLLSAAAVYFAAVILL